MENEVQERFERIENILERFPLRQEQQIVETDKVNEAARTLIAVGRTCLDSIKELHEQHDADYQKLREQHDADYKKLLEAQAATDEKLNILIDTVDRIIRHRNGKE